MAVIRDIVSHYASSGLLGAIRGGLEALGKRDAALTIDDFAPVDEFHIGGRQASEDIFKSLELSSEMRVLDIGCGLGGAARFATTRYAVKVAGIDATPDYVTTGNEICKWLGVEGRVSLEQGDALALPFADATFERAYMMHVGMNIVDKAALAREVARVLRPGGAFGIYDIMRVGDGDLTYPVPWATTAETCAVAGPADYRRALEAAGFAHVTQRVRNDLAQAFFERLRANASAAGGPPPLGLHLLMGQNTRDKVRNMIENVSAGRLAPVEIIARLDRAA
jgi:ubiquinone/menaquinone biosynthesis C-methylase UbiE